MQRPDPNAGVAPPPDPGGMARSFQTKIGGVSGEGDKLCPSCEARYGRDVATCPRDGTALVDEDKLSRILQELMDLSPRGIGTELGRERAYFARTAAYGHFGRKPEPDGGFSWERLALVEELRRAF